MHAFPKAAALLACLAACGGSEPGETPGASSIHGVAVPPDPGPAASVTLAGVDSDGNGIRDEVDRALAREFGADPGQHDAVRRAARLNQQYILAGGDPGLATTLQVRGVNVGACIALRFPASPAGSGQRAIRRVFALSADTLPRLRAFQATEAASLATSLVRADDPCGAAE